MIRAAAVALFLAASAVAASAACVDGPISALTMKDGAKARVVSRKGQKIVLEHSAMAETWRQELWLGVFPVWTLLPEGRITWRYDMSLPKIGAFKPGATIVQTGRMIQPNGQTEEISTEVTVEREAINKIGGCKYRVLRLMVRQSVEGKLVSIAQQDLHLPSLLVLHIVNIDPRTGKRQPDLVARVE